MDASNTLTTPVDVSEVSTIIGGAMGAFFGVVVVGSFYYFHRNKIQEWMRRIGSIGRTRSTRSENVTADTKRYRYNVPPGNEDKESEML